jgi:hypothetical protein
VKDVDEETWAAVQVEKVGDVSFKIVEGVMGSGGQRGKASGCCVDIRRSNSRSELRTALRGKEADWTDTVDPE